MTMSSSKLGVLALLVCAGPIWAAEEVRPTSDVKVEETKTYWTSVGMDIMADATGDPDKRNGLYVISGTLKNVSNTPVRAVMLEFSLLGRDGAVLHRRESYNRAAEALLDVGGDPLAAIGTRSDISPIAPGSTDTFRMIFIGEEIPLFDHSAVAVRAVR